MILLGVHLGKIQGNRFNRYCTSKANTPSTPPWFFHLGLLNLGAQFQLQVLLMSILIPWHYYHRGTYIPTSSRVSSPTAPPSASQILLLQHTCLMTIWKTYESWRFTKCYPLVIKHGVPENGPFKSVMFRWKPPFSSGIFQQAMFDYQRIGSLLGLLH